MDVLLILDTCFRLFAAGQLMLIGLLVARSPAPRELRAVTVLLFVSVTCYLALASSAVRGWFLPIWPPVQFFSMSAPLFLWLFAHRLLERPVDRRIAIASGVILALSWLDMMRARYVTHQWPWAGDIAMHTLSLLLALHAIRIAWSERGDDLIERRRAFRIGFVIVVSVQTIGVILAETVYGFGHGADWLGVLQSGTTFVTVMVLGGVLLTANAELLFDTSAPAAPEPAPALSPAEHVLRQKLDTAMAEGVYREPGLSIGGLAERLGVPEHRLRALINQRLGYRNFSTFLNEHRITEARAWLADPAKVNLPVLTMAMDLGYGSLAPFNRAFRDATGQTPTDYRKAMIVGAGNP
ncbi:helix-turn-helix domain-containing protein [Sphingomonas sp.]|uniref:AraC family transcriptional regulator n=1 Tax=Sphingomonas sp. TaxID=28214 RepID=UPI001B26879E|nr:helix-turn-helix domain-containing protein [Sphingomonas sp.]MBO9714645.1 AraC family transcriptional regulator [Sphingomonas sp.]